MIMQKLISTTAFLLASILSFSSAQPKIDYDRWNTETIEDNVVSTRRCSMKEDGFYGRDSGTSTTVSLPFYEVEIASSSEKSSAKILEEIERGFVDVVLPALFPDDCLPVTMGLRKRRRLGARGVSTQPPDAVLDGVECATELSSDENSCIFVESSFTIYTTDEASSEVQVMARNAIQTAIFDGYFVNKDIARMSLAEDIPLTTNQNPFGVETMSDGGTVSAGNNIVIYTVVPIVVSVFIVGAALYLKRRNSPDVEVA